MSPGPVFCLLLGESWDHAQLITGQVTEVTCPVIGRAQPELTPSNRQKTGPGGHCWDYCHDTLTFLSSPCSSFEDWVSVYFIDGYLILKWVAVAWLNECNRISSPGEQHLPGNVPYCLCSTIWFSIEIRLSVLIQAPGVLCFIFDIMNSYEVVRLPNILTYTAAKPGFQVIEFPSRVSCKFIRCFSEVFATSRIV